MEGFARFEDPFQEGELLEEFRLGIAFFLCGVRVLRLGFDRRVVSVVVRRHLWRGLCDLGEDHSKGSRLGLGRAGSRLSNFLSFSPSR